MNAADLVALAMDGRLPGMLDLRLEDDLSRERLRDALAKSRDALAVGLWLDSGGALKELTVPSASPDGVRRLVEILPEMVLAVCDEEALGMRREISRLAGEDPFSLDRLLFLDWLAERMRGQAIFVGRNLQRLAFAAGGGAVWSLELPNYRRRL